LGRLLCKSQYVPSLSWQKIVFCVALNTQAKPLMVGVCFVCVQAGFFLSFIGLCFGFVNGVVVPWLIVRMSAASIMTGAKDALFAPVVY
jgi:hypothetical protein